MIVSPPFTLGATRAEPQRTVFEVLFGNFAESQSKDLRKGTIDDEESTEDYGYLSDSDLEDDEDEKVASLKRASLRSKVQPSDQFGVADEDKRIFLGEHKERVEKGKVVKIPDIAFVT